MSNKKDSNFLIKKAAGFLINEPLFSIWKKLYSEKNIKKVINYEK